MYWADFPGGALYVVLPSHPTGLIEAFEGDWVLPRHYFCGVATSLRQLRRRLHAS